MKCKESIINSKLLCLVICVSAMQRWSNPLPSHDFTKPNPRWALSHTTIPNQTHAELPVTQLYQTKPSQSLSSQSHNYTKPNPRWASCYTTIPNQTLTELSVTKLYQTKLSLSSLLAVTQLYQTKPHWTPCYTSIPNHASPRWAPCYTSIQTKPSLSSLLHNYTKPKPSMSSLLYSYTKLNPHWASCYASTVYQTKPSIQLYQTKPILSSWSSAPPRLPPAPAIFPMGCIPFRFWNFVLSLSWGSRISHKSYFKGNF